MKFFEFQKADPVAWSLSAWVEVYHVFRHFKGFFVNLATFKVAKLTIGQFGQFKAIEPGSKLVTKIAKFDDFWSF